MFLGDTVLVDYDAEAVDFQDVLNVCGLREFAGLAWIQGLLASGQYAALRDAQAADLADLERFTAGTADLLEARYFLARALRRAGVRGPGAAPGQRAAGLLAATAARGSPVPAAPVRRGGDAADARGVRRTESGRQRLRHRLAR
jgi:hypothetical protein